MVAEIHHVLKQAVLDKTALRLTAQFGPSTTHTAKALQWSESPGPEGLGVHLPEDGEMVLARFGSALPAVSASFAVNQNRYAFESKVLSRNRRFWMNDSVMLDALLLAVPAEVRKVDERRHPRLPVSQGSGVSAQLVRLDKRRAEVAAAAAQALIPVDGTLNDLSLVGAGFICAPDRALLAAQRGERLACIVDFRGTKLVLACSLARVTSVSTRAMRVGVDFAAHENEQAMAGKLAELAGVVAELERQEALRLR